MPDHAKDPAPRPSGRGRPPDVIEARGAGLAGPTRRYLAIVAFLASTASLPILSAFGAGSSILDGSPAADTAPFLPPPTAEPILVVPLRPPLSPQPDPGPPIVGLGEAEPRPFTDPGLADEATVSRRSRPGEPVRPELHRTRCWTAVLGRG